MKLREHKRVLILLNQLAHYLELTETPKLSPKLLKLYTDEELIYILCYLYSKEYSRKKLKRVDRVELIDKLNSDYGVLLWTIHHLEKKMSKVLTNTQKEVDEFFSHGMRGAHYLSSKAVVTWDEYDTANYYSLLAKTGTSKQVFAIFTSDVKEKDKYIVTTAPTLFFDTQEEAEEEMERCYEQGFNNWGSLKVMSLWRIST
ncbi:MAG: hypothetical protein ACSHW7_02215 [Patiriisocius sp.]|uniref:hypothetical protein n=1 Tax=Patiriisocius sp. TaxID=2822396 RepID=UPI003EF24637